VTALWQVPTGHPATGPVAVAAQHIVLAGADGTLRGLRRADGRADWTREAGAGVSVATRIQDGVAYATTAGGDLLAVDAATGEVQWRRKTGGRFSDRPFVARPRVYAGGLDSVLYAYELGGDHRRWRVWTGGEIRHRPVVVGKIAVVAGRDGRLYGVNDAGGWVWQRSVGQVEHPPAAGGDAVCVAVTDGSVTCLRATDGRRPVRISLPGTALSVLNCGEGVVYAAAADRTVGAWDTRTGALRWRYRPGVTGPAAADLVVHDGQVQVAYPDGRLAGIDAATGRERWHHTVNDTFDSAPKGDGQALFVVGRTGTAYALAVPSSPTPSATSPAATPPTSATTTEPTATPAPYKRRTQRPQRSSPPTSPTTPSSEATTGSPSPDQTTPTAPDQERRQSPQREPETHSVISSPASRSHPRSAVVNIVS
jgi:outer membrane protein assembly factor BamB